jgi:sugar lactone lactonase YvrE
MPDILRCITVLLPMATLSWAQSVPPITLRPGALSAIAGSGTSDYSGDNGPALEAGFRQPWGVAIAGRNLYIADTGNNVIRQVNMNDGNVYTFAGNGEQSYSGDGGLATSAALNTPTSVAVDFNGNVYIADSGNNVIRKIDANGLISTVAGNMNGTISPESTNSVGDGSLATASLLWNPTAVAVDGAGNLYIADTYNNRIRRVDGSTQIITTVAGSGTAGYLGDGSNAQLAEINMPIGLALDRDGDIALVDAANVVRWIDHSTQKITTIAGGGNNPGNDSLGDGGIATGATLTSPMGLAFDATGSRLFISDSMDGLVREVDLVTGNITVVAGIDPARWLLIGSSGPLSPTTSPLDTNLSVPAGIAFDGTGNLYIADSGNQVVRQLSFDSASIVIYGGTGTVEVINNGSTTVSISDTLSGPDSNAFFPQIQTCTEISAGSSCAMAISLQSQDVGWLSATMTLTIGGQPYIVAMTGFSVGSALVQPSVTSLAFDSTQIGVSTVETVTLSNGGDTIANIAVSLDGSSDFSLQSNDCSDLSSSSSCELSVAFDPSSVGDASGTLSISPGTSSPLQIALTGVGLGQPRLSTVPSISATQGMGTIGTYSVTVTNSGTADGPVRASVAGDASWSLSKNNCSDVLLVGASCTILVAFDAQTLGTHSGSLILSTTSQSLTVPLIGTGSRRVLHLLPGRAARGAART